MFYNKPNYNLITQFEYLHFQHHMQFLSLVSSKQLLQLSLAQQPINYPSTNNKNESDDYISSVLIIDQNTICAISQHTLQFFSISKTSNNLNNNIENSLLHIKQSNRLIGSIRVNQELKQQFNNYYDRQQFVEEQSFKISEQKIVHKETNFSNPIIIQEKGVAYDCRKKIFSILVSTQHNKYLLTFNINFKHSSVSQKLETQSQIKQKQQTQIKPSECYQTCLIEIQNFMVVYNFATPNEIVKYNLQVDPQLLYLQQSQTLILIRKFYSDSLVIVFRARQEPFQSQFLSHSVSTLNRNQSNESEESYLNLLKKKSSHNKTNKDLNFPLQYKCYWSFYINQECLSLLDNSRYLVNYRQVIAKLHLEIDIIDTLSKQKISFIVRQQIVPMTIKHIQLLPPGDNQASSKGLKLKQMEEQLEGQKSAPFSIRIFSVLRHKQASCIMDYDVVHDLINVYTMENILIQKISQFDKSHTFSFVNFLYLDKNYVGLLRKKLVKEEQNKDEISGKFIQDLIATGVEFGMDSLTWNSQLQIILQSRISLRTQLMDIKVSKIIDKKTHYIHMLDQLKLKHPILQNNQFINQIFQLLSTQ